LILYYGIYKFVGEFGAGTLVDAIETFFEAHINPWVNGAIATLIPWPVLQDLFGNDYGMITLGLRYAIAIVLPVVTTYFLMFSILEDSGYLPRLSLMLDHLFKAIGLSGRAVIPMVLGLGCDTMATMVTRTLETKRERLLASFLLALVVPCAAQWGVILGLLAQRPAALTLWGSIIIGIFLLVGTLANRILPDQSASFYMDVPPLRLPNGRNILTKTYVRVKWYFWEIVPLFMWASLFIWLGRLTGLFDLLIRGLEPITAWLGLPASTAPIFLYGFFRRDYGAAGLFDLQQGVGLTGNQLVIAAVVLTLFLPCIAQLQILIKEQGLKTALGMVGFIIPFALGIGILLNGMLSLLHIVV
ncbi:MAG: nucleoside recognition domain-containing protein, partial [Leptolyngbyaceae bacterium]|nr:nucleoside recognition domain-containing protein [Leptolyngbyaceae bacterium]